MTLKYSSFLVKQAKITQQSYIIDFELNLISPAWINILHHQLS